MTDIQSSKSESLEKQEDYKNQLVSQVPTTNYTYATLMETNGEECESWLYFIRYQGNEENLKNLNEQLEQVDWFVMDDLSTFDLELDFLVCEKTAKEMTKIDLNHKSFNRKFDGTLKKINLGLKKKDKNEKKIKRAFDKLGYGQIEEYIDKEDIDEEDLATHTESDSDEESEESSSDEESSDQEVEQNNNLKKIPKALRDSNLPRFAKAKRKNRKNK